MPSRFPYAGTAGLASNGYPSIPIQNETTAYLNRFSSQPSVTYKNALNTAIYKWKQAGVYALLQDLWLFVADTQADSLRNLVTAARDATTSGAPAFTANKGFSGLGASNYVSMPFSTTGLSAANSGQLFAGWFDASTAAGATLISGSGAGGVTLVSFDAGTKSGLRFDAASNVASIGSVSTGGNVAAVIGAVNTSMINPVCVVGSGGTMGSWISSPALANAAGAVKLLGWGTMPTATAAQVRRFLSILQSFLDEMGALT